MCSGYLHVIIRFMTKLNLQLKKKSKRLAKVASSTLSANILSLVMMFKQ